MLSDEYDHKCKERKKCFAKGPHGGCSLLISTYEREGMCPFCKPVQRMTKGKIYGLKRGNK